MTSLGLWWRDNPIAEGYDILGHLWWLITVFDWTSKKPPGKREQICSGTFRDISQADRPKTVAWRLVETWIWHFFNGFSWIKKSHDRISKKCPKRLEMMSSGTFWDISEADRPWDAAEKSSWLTELMGWTSSRPMLQNCMQTFKAPLNNRQQIEEAVLKRSLRPIVWRHNLNV